jgi:hypothetical protein
MTAACTRWFPSENGEREHRKTGRHEDDKKMRGKYLSSSSGLPFFPSSFDLRLFR